MVNDFAIGDPIEIRQWKYDPETMKAVEIWIPATVYSIKYGLCVCFSDGQRVHINNATDFRKPKGE